MPGFHRPGHIFLPPYSPNLNIIEIPFSSVKSDTIVVAMGDIIPAFDAITSELVLPWIKDCRHRKQHIIHCKSLFVTCYS